MLQSFGEKVKQLRINKNLTLREIAEKLDVDISFLSKIEKDKRKPTSIIITQLSEIFNVEEKELIISHLSDKIVYSLQDEEYVSEILRTAEKKIKYIVKNKDRELCN